VVVTVYSAEKGVDLDGLAIIAAGAAVHLSDLPFDGPVAGLGTDANGIEMVISRTRDGLVMVEGSASEVPEAALLDAFDASEPALAPALDAIDRLRDAAGRPRQVFEPAPADPEETAARTRILDGERADGRGPADVREVSVETGVLGSCHGSALFTRGDTQALVSVTFGGNRDAQDIETLWGSRKERFLLHYNFPAFSVGSIRPNRGPGRREIGHGNLARRALVPVLPPKKTWPYTTRVVSDITESDGSSSMATVCGGCLALIESGVPLRAPVAGIAMGLVSDGERYVVLSDIRGAEDHIGDMDFKLAGPADGVTAFQLDNKLGAVPREVLTAALEQAAVGRREILEAMQPALDALSARTPEQSKLARTQIAQRHIGKLIGPGGRNLQAIQKKTGARIDVSDDGVVLVLGPDPESTQAALQAVTGVGLELKKDGLYLGEVTSVKAFGAFVRIGDHESLVHNSEGGEALEVGSQVLVRVLGADAKGRLRLSAKAAANANREDALNV
jgi:polyribonucleotide nucleotidyltransferase